MDLNRLEEALLTEGMRLKTSLVAMETTHNNAGGTVLPLDHMRSVYGMANSRGISVHLDGRACTTPPWRWASRRWTSRSTPTLCRCACPGLSAPVGAVLAGPRPLLAGRTLRRMLGGAQRQAGIMGAAGLEAVQTMGGRLAEDHATAARLSEGLNRLHPRLSATVPQTNIVQVETADSGMGNAQWVQALAAEGADPPLGRDAAALRDPSPHRRGRHRPRRANLRPGAAGQLNRLSRSRLRPGLRRGFLVDCIACRHAGDAIMPHVSSSPARITSARSPWW